MGKRKCGGGQSGKITKTLNPKSKSPKALDPKSSEIKQESEDEELGEGKVGGGNGFFACYLLTSLNPRHKGHTYIGFTVNPRRRIRQHNGEIGSGAWRTKRKRPWEMVFCIHGFPTNVSALQFEWAWQHPVESLAVRKAAVAFKSLNGLANKIKLAHTMLTLPAWESMDLTVNYFSTKYKHHCAGCPDLPPHMKVVVRSMDELPCYTGGENVLDDDSLEDEECSGMGGSDKSVLVGSELEDEMAISYSTDDHNCINKATPVQSRISDLFRQKKRRANSPSKEEGHREQPYIDIGSPERSFKKTNGDEYIGDFYCERPFCDFDFKEKAMPSIVTNPNDGVEIDREDEMPISYSADDHSCINKDTPVQSRFSGSFRPKKARANSPSKEEGHREQPYIDIGSPEMSFKKPNGDEYSGDYNRDSPFSDFDFTERVMPSFFTTPNEGVEIDREDYREPTIFSIGSPDEAIPSFGTNPNGDAELDKEGFREPTICFIGSPDKVIPFFGNPNGDVIDKEDCREPTVCFIGSPDKTIPSFGTNPNGDVEVVAKVDRGQAFCNVVTPETAIPSFVTEASDVEIVGVARETGRIELDRPWQQNMSTTRVDKDASLIKNPVILSELEVIDVFTPSPEFQIASHRKKRGNSAVSAQVIDLTESPSSV